MLRLAAVLAALAAPAMAQDVVEARYEDPTPRYDHGVLGDAIEYGTLALRLADGRRLRIVLPETRVFEDTAPRVVDLDGDGAAEVIAVETDLALGARLSVYGPRGLIAANDFIGRTHRWLAPVGAADLDGDGFTEIAYVDRPHLAKRLVILRFRNGALEPAAAFDGFTNHRIGDDRIWGGIRDCGNGPEMVLADAGFDRIVVVRWGGDVIASGETGLRPTPGNFIRVLACG